jgi:hypothetical protein
MMRRGAEHRQDTMDPRQQPPTKEPAMTYSLTSRRHLTASDIHHTTTTGARISAALIGLDVTAPCHGWRFSTASIASNGKTVTLSWGCPLVCTEDREQHLHLDLEMTHRGRAAGFAATASYRIAAHAEQPDIGQSIDTSPGGNMILANRGPSRFSAGRMEQFASDILTALFSDQVPAARLRRCGAEQAQGRFFDLLHNGWFITAGGLADRTADVA